MSLFLTFFFVAAWFLETKSVYEAYVDSSGDNNALCTHELPCGAFQFVLQNIKNEIIKDDDIIIRVSGTNPAYKFQTSVDCQFIIAGNLTIIFDSETIKSTEDWWLAVDDCIQRYYFTFDYMLCIYPWTPFPCTPFIVPPYASLTFVNMIWDKPHWLLSSLKGSTFRCENCTISGPQRQTFLLSSTATFYNCTFKSITPASAVDYFFHDSARLLAATILLTPTEDTHTSVFFDQCSFIDNTFYPFIQMQSLVNYQKNVRFKDCVFTMNTQTPVQFINVTTLSSVASSVRDTIHIEACQFIDDTATYSSSVGGLQLLHVTESAKVDIVMDDVYISYSRARRNDWNEAEDVPFKVGNSIVFIASADANVQMNNVSIMPHHHCPNDPIQVIGGDIAMIEEPKLPYCLSPFPFMYNNGLTALKNVKLLTDNLKTKNLTSGNMGIYYMRFAFYNGGTSPFYAAFLNDENGVLNISNMNVEAGSHYSILYNRGGVVNINGLYTNSSAYYDRSQLKMATGITNSFGTLNIANSVLSGVDISLIDVYGGSASIVDSVLSRSMNAITTYLTADEIHLDNVSIFEVGKYYASVGAAYFYSVNCDFCTIPPVYLSADKIDIKISNLDFAEPFGMLSISQIGVLESVLDNNAHIEIVNIMSSAFIFSHHLSSTEYRGNEYFADFEYLLSSLDHLNASNDVSAEVAAFIGNINNNAHSSAARIISVGRQYQMTFALNSLYNGIEGNGTSFFIDTWQDNCMAANTFHNIDIEVKSGDIKSCKHMSITPDFKCGSDLGPMNKEFGKSYFINSSLEIEQPAFINIDDAHLDLLNGNNIIQMLGNGTQNLTFMLFDSVLSNTKFELPFHCHIVCQQVVNNDISHIKQLIIRCNPAALGTSAQSQMQSFAFYSPYSLLLHEGPFVQSKDNNTASLYPGGHLNFSIFDEYGNIVEKVYYPNDLTLYVFNDDINLNAYISIVVDGVCVACEEGISVGITTNHIDESFTLHTQVLNDLLFSEDLNITVAQCPSGYGIPAQSIQCSPCQIGYYSLGPNVEPCRQCDSNDNIQCLGQNDIVVQYNHWMMINGDYMISSNCPNGYCCQNLHGCNYLKDNMCTTNRDPSSPLCGKCLMGYSELLGSEDCDICERHHYEYLVVPFLIASILSLYFYCFDRRNQRDLSKLEDRSGKQPKEVAPKRMLIKDDFKALQIMIFKVMLYFVQSVSFILMQRDVTKYFRIILPIFQISNLLIDFGSFGYCAISGMNAKQEILLNTTGTFMLLLIILTVGLIGFCIKQFSKCRCCKRIVGNFYSALLRGLLMTIGGILAVLFKLLSCTKINELYVHFYFGADECFDVTWIMSLLFLLSIVLMWVWFNFHLYKMSESDRSSKQSNNLYRLVYAYKDKYWYWESILFSRRLLLALCVMISDGSNYLKNTLVVLLCIYLMIHCWLKPFIHKRVNKLETMCLIILITILIYLNSNINSDILDVLLIICCLAPILFVIYECGRLCVHKKMNESRISEDKLVELYHRNDQNKKIAQPKHLKTTNQTKVVNINPITFEENDNETKSVAVAKKDIFDKQQNDMNTDDESSDSSYIEKQMHEMFGHKQKSAVIDSMCLEDDANKIKRLQQEAYAVPVKNDNPKGFNDKEVISSMNEENEKNAEDNLNIPRQQFYDWTTV